MNIEDEKRLLLNSAICGMRALRLALTALLDASADIIANFAGDPGSDEPEEIERERVKNWNIVRPLLLSAAKDIESYAKMGGLGTDYTRGTIELCESTIEALKQEDSDERMTKRLEPFIEKLRADPDNYQTIRLEALLAGLPKEVAEITFPAIVATRDTGNHK